MSDIDFDEEELKKSHLGAIIIRMREINEDHEAKIKELEAKIEAYQTALRIVVREGKY